MSAERAHALEMLIPAAEILARVEQLGATLERDLRRAPEPPLVIGILKGSTFFLADLLRAMSAEVTLDFMSISSYGNAVGQSGIVRILKDLEQDIGGRDVLIVEDIVDTGLTLSYLRKTLSARAPRSLRTVTLLDKSARRIVPVPIEYRGFEVPDVFVIGYGLDFQGLYRNLSDLVAVTDMAKLTANPRLLIDAGGRVFGDRGVSFGT